MQIVLLQFAFHDQNLIIRYYSPDKSETLWKVLNRCLSSIDDTSVNKTNSEVKRISKLCRKMIGRIKFSWTTKHIPSWYRQHCLGNRVSNTALNLANTSDIEWQTLAFRLIICLTEAIFWNFVNHISLCPFFCSSYRMRFPSNCRCRFLFPNFERRYDIHIHQSGIRAR